MQQANNFFFLTGCDDHILVDFRRFDNTTMLTFKRRDDVYHCLDLEVSPHPTKPHHFVIAYTFDTATTNDGGTSDPIPAPEVYGVIAGMANIYLPKV